MSAIGLADVRTWAAETNSIARFWNEEVLAAIRIDRPNPPVHARNLFTLSAAMYDAWAAYHSMAVGYIYHNKHSTNDPARDRREAISYAAYRILKERFALSVNSAVTLARLDSQLAALGYDTNNVSTDPRTPAGLGNAVAAELSEWFLQDGSRQAERYQDAPPIEGGYASVNGFLVPGLPGIVVSDINRWQPLAIANAIDQNGVPAGPTQSFLGPQWLNVRPFALFRAELVKPWIDTGPPPRHNGQTHAEFIKNVVECIRRGAELDPGDGITLDISPGTLGNSSLGTNDGTGHRVNPVAQEPYRSNVVLRADFTRVLAEFWADGPESETPPGHWNVLANEAVEHPSFERRFAGSGPVLEQLEWDVKMYFALNAALHDAACAAWSLKRYYDGWRPISAIRYTGALGQSSDPELPSYNPLGLPLIPGLIELVTPQTARLGAKHEGLSVNRLAIKGWPGQPADPKTQVSGVKWMHPGEWLPYQRTTFVTPAFPGYVSGHSTFSRAAAEVLTAITGSEFFPGGIKAHRVPRNTLIHEKGPTADVVIQWASYYDAADQAGLSRIWGGIHPPADDLNGRVVGATCGKNAWALAKRYYDGSILTRPQLTIRHAGSGCEIQFETVRGFHYTVQTTPDLALGFASVGSVWAENLIATKVIAGRSNTFVRILRKP